MGESGTTRSIEMDDDITTVPTGFALGVAARCWCEESTKNTTMDPVLATEFARVIDIYRNALMWCGGSSDFAEGGQARVGWIKSIEPLLRQKDYK